MVVQGHEITDSQEQAILARMRAASFCAGDLQSLAETEGIPPADGLSMRVADRMIQREKKSANIRFANRTWFWIGPR